MNCPICNQSNTILVQKDYVFSNNSEYDIFDCNSCLSRFIMPFEADLNVYENFYSTNDTSYEYEKTMIIHAQQFYNSKNIFEYKQWLFNHSEKFAFIIKEIESYLQHTPNPRILEIGSSYGYLSGYFLLKGLNVYGIDVSKSAVEKANTIYGEHFATSNLEDIQGEFDIIFHVGLIGVVDNPTEFLENMIKKLNPNGILIFNAPNKASLKSDKWVSTEPPDLRAIFSPSTFCYMLKSIKGIRIEAFTGVPKYNVQCLTLAIKSCSINKILQSSLSTIKRICYSLLGKQYQYGLYIKVQK